MFPLGRSRGRHEVISTGERTSSGYSITFEERREPAEVDAEVERFVEGLRARLRPSRQSELRKRAARRRRE